MGLLKDTFSHWFGTKDTKTPDSDRVNPTENKQVEEKNRLLTVATEEGVMLFSDSKKGLKARGSYLQYLADGFFNLTKIPETLRLYEIEMPTRHITEQADTCIDKLSKSDLRSEDTQLRKSEFSFTEEKFAGKELPEGAVCVGKYDLRPDFLNFDRLTKDFSLGISPRNYDIASLLYISENGYAGHVAMDYFHPFSYQREFKDLAEKLADSMEARRNAPLSAHDFGYGTLQKEAKEMAKDILQSEFHISDGEFRLSGKMKAPVISVKKETPEISLDKPEEKQDEKPKSTRQAKHAPSAIPQKREKKQLII